MRVLIIGASGYIGRNLTRHLSSNGFQVIAGYRNHNVSGVLDDNVLKCSIDLKNPTSYKSILYDVDRIIYLAGPGSPLREQSTGNLVQDHLVSMASFLEENARSVNCPVIFSSSGGTIYGRGIGIPFRETDSLDAINPYGLLKVLCEQLLKHYFQNRGTKYISMRISNPYGGIAHTKTDQGVINVFSRKALSREPIEIWGDESSIRDYIYMPDLMNAFVSCIRSKDYTGPLNIGGGAGTSLFNICQLIEAKSDFKFKKIFIPQNPLLVKSSVLDISLAKFILNWSPLYSIEDGISHMFDQSR